MVFAVNTGKKQMVSNSPLKRNLKLNKMQLKKIEFINKHDINFGFHLKNSKPMIMISKKNK